MPEPIDVTPPQRFDLLGYRLHPMTCAEVIGQIGAAVAQQRRLIIANLNLHGMAMMFESPGMARLLAQDDCLVMVDGMPVLQMINFVHRAGLGHDKRTTSLDFYDEMFEHGVASGWKFAYVGAKSDVLTRGMEILQDRFRGLRIEGRDGYFDIDDFSPGSRNAGIVEWLRQLDPDIVIVGMGMPRQEEWIERIQHHVDVRVFLPTGAYLDYQVGTQKPPPRWLGRYGLEWAYRLARSPYRLGYRYLIEPFILAYRLITKATLPNKPQPGAGA